MQQTPSWAGNRVNLSLSLWKIICFLIVLIEVLNTIKSGPNCFQTIASLSDYFTMAADSELMASLSSLKAATTCQENDC